RRCCGGPKAAHNTFCLSVAHMSLGRILAYSSRMAGGEKRMDLALSLIRQLDPDNHQYMRHHAYVLANLCGIYSSTHRRKQAEHGLLEALALNERLVKLEPDAWDLRQRIAMLELDLGNEYV